jgi:hypothetical protein
MGLGAALAPVTALGDMTKDECIEANGKGQDLIHDGKLSAARRQLQSCAAASCPKMVRSDCTKRLDDLDARQPAIVFEAKDASGNDVGAVSVTMDGAPVAQRLDGTSLRLDPGEHVFVFTMAGAAPVTKKLVLSEGDRGRRERVVFEQPSTFVPAPAAPATPARAPAPEQSETREAEPTASAVSGTSTLRVLGVVSGGLGIASLGVGGAFAVMASSALSDQRSACASPTDCRNHAEAVSDHTRFTTQNEVSTVGFVAGGALVVAGAAMFLLGGAHAQPGTTTGVLAVPEVAPGEAGLVLRGVF